MSATERTRLSRIFREVEGYLELEMPLQALAALERLQPEQWRHSRALHLKGEVLRSIGRYGDAIAPLRQAAETAPSNISIWLALGWCYKRTGKINAAIEALERAAQVDETEPLVQYNLACYCSLAGEKIKALDYLARSFSMDAHYRDLVSAEPDFDPLRADPDFQSLVGSTIV